MNQVYQTDQSFREPLSASQGGTGALYSKLVTIQFALAILGYPVVGVLGSLLAPESSAGAVAYRASAVGLSIVMVGLSLWERRASGRLDLTLAALLLVYSLRLLIDFYSGQFPELGWNAAQFYGFCVVPLLGVAVLSNFRSADQDTKFMFIVGLLVCCLFTAMVLAGVSSVSLATEEFQGRVAVARLNPISVGHMGASTIIASLAMIFEHRGGSRTKPFLFLAFAAALYCLFVAESRGPLLSLGVAVLALLAVKRRWKSMSFLFAIGFGYALWSSNSGGGLFDRLREIGSDQSSLSRLDLQSLAFSEFIQSPILGSAHVELLTGGYSHNLLLDAAMSTGVIGLGLLVWLLIKLGGACVRLLRAGQLLLPLLAIQYTAAAQFSGSMFSSPEFWMCAALALSAARGLRPVALSAEPLAQA